MHVRTEDDNRKEEQRKYIELSQANQDYIAALKLSLDKRSKAIDDWNHEEFPMHESEEAKLNRLPGGLVSIDESKLQEGIWTRAGATRSIVIEKGEKGVKTFPQGNSKSMKFDKIGWEEVLRNKQEQQGQDTITFDFNGRDDIGVSQKIFGKEMNKTRLLAMEQMEGVMEIAKAKGMAVELGPNAKALIKEVSLDVDYKGKFKNSKGEPVPYSHKIEEDQQYLRDNRDYQNLKLGLGDHQLRDFNDSTKNPSEAFDSNYKKKVFQKIDKDGKPVVPEKKETDWKLRAEAAEKAIKELETKLNANDEIVTKLDKIKEGQLKLIDRSQDEVVLDEIQKNNKKGVPARSERDIAVDKVETRKTYVSSCVAELIKSLEADIAKIKANPAALTSADGKEAIAKNEKSLEALKGTIREKITEQTSKAQEIKNWEKPNGGRDKTIESQKDKILKDRAVDSAPRAI